MGEDEREHEAPNAVYMMMSRWQHDMTSVHIICTMSEKALKHLDQSLRSNHPRVFCETAWTRRLFCRSSLFEIRFASYVPYQEARYLSGGIASGCF